ncbi:hypothetical protein [Ornithinibacillus halotolerans]|uniref:Uncharacterized protein n=1 Tax=Ornithinibacillus halotolerans TaxID=1274357 RepID=A0A916S1F3_9BACI|nr:hypothetical protein [Ornithinibacillus halotolerans]GGA80118.1 hypothetical protein GCM10008025_24390 [Ornithinibacillus halotolerans]
MTQSIPLTNWKSLVEKKISKKILIKMMWNEQEKLTLFITPNMKINSFIYDEKEGYLFYDVAGKLIDYPIPSIITEQNMIDGEIDFQQIQKGKIQISKQRLSKEDIQNLINP